MTAATPTRRGTSNGNARGSSRDRAARRAFLLATFGDGATCPCYRCGTELEEDTLTVDRVVPGRDGGRYTRDNIRPACGKCNSETGARLAQPDARRTVIGVDPGLTTGLARIDLDGHRDPFTAQVRPEVVVATVEMLVGAQDPTEVCLAIEEFVVGPRAARSSTPAGGRTARGLIAVLSAEFSGRGARVVIRPAATVKPWATDKRLRAAGLYFAWRPHARDAARHALYAAVRDCGFPDPLSSTAHHRSPR